MMSVSQGRDTVGQYIAFGVERRETDFIDIYSTNYVIHRPK